MTIPIRFESEADDELVAAFEWYEARRPGLGQDFVDEALARLAELPDASTPVPGVPGCARYSSVRRFPSLRHGAPLSPPLGCPPNQGRFS